MHNDGQAPIAGCDGGPDAAAGCVQAAGEDGPAGDDARLGAQGSAGCAPQAQADSLEPKVTPPTTVRKFERALRGLGFTRKQAADIARRGFTAATAAAELEDTEPDGTQRLREALQSFARTLKG